MYKKLGYIRFYNLFRYHFLDIFYIIRCMDEFYVFPIRGKLNEYFPSAAYVTKECSSQLY